MKEIVISQILRCPRSKSKVSILTCQKCNQFRGIAENTIQCDFQKSCEPLETITIPILLGLKEWIDSHPDPKSFLTSLLLEARKHELRMEGIHDS